MKKFKQIKGLTFNKKPLIVYLRMKTKLAISSTNMHKIVERKLHKAI